MIDHTPTLQKLKNCLDCLSDNEKNCLKDLSYPFIPNYDPFFASSKHRVLLVGQETKGWRGKLKDFLATDFQVEDAILSSKKRYIELYQQSAKRSRFHQFLKKIIKTNNNEPVQWLNFYLFDYKMKSFNKLSKRPEYKNICNELESIAIENLSQQINQLQPKVIFFVGKYHNNFPKLEESLNLKSCEDINFKNTVKNFRMYIWNNETLVLRMPHPAHWRASSNLARQLALDHFKLFSQSENIADFKARL